MADNTPVPQSDDFDAALDAYVDGAAPARQDATAPVAEPAKAEVAQPATAPSTAATTATDDDDSDDAALPVETRFTRAQKREARLATEREQARQQAAEASRQVLSYQGNLKQEADRRREIAAERDDLKKRLESEEARIESYWQDAIKTAPEEQKAAYREAYELDKAKREIATERQQIDLAKQQRQRQHEELRQRSEQEARHYAIAEPLQALDEEARQAGLPIALLKPIKDWLTSPEVQIATRTLPLKTDTVPPADINQWGPQHLDDLDKYRTWVVYQTIRGFDHFKQQHEQQQLAQNQKKAAETYQPEKPVGAGVGRQQRAWDEMDFDEAMDAVYQT